MTRRYPILPAGGRGLIVAAVICAVLGIVLLHQSSRPHARVLQGFALDRESARVLFLVLAALAFAIVGLVLTMHVRRRVKELLVTDKAIILDHFAVRFDEITSVEEHTVKHEPFVIVRSEHRQIQIAKRHLPDGAYDEVVAVLESRERRS